METEGANYFALPQIQPAALTSLEEKNTHARSSRESLRGEPGMLVIIRRRCQGVKLETLERMTVPFYQAGQVFDNFRLVVSSTMPF